METDASVSCTALIKQWGFWKHNPSVAGVNTVMNGNVASSTSGLAGTETQAGTAVGT